MTQKRRGRGRPPPRCASPIRPAARASSCPPAPRYICSFRTTTHQVPLIRGQGGERRRPPRRKRLLLAMRAPGARGQRVARPRRDAKAQVGRRIERGQRRRNGHPAPADAAAPSRRRRTPTVVVPAPSATNSGGGAIIVPITGGEQADGEGGEERVRDAAMTATTTAPTTRRRPPPPVVVASGRVDVADVCRCEEFHVQVLVGVLDGSVLRLGRHDDVGYWLLLPGDIILGGRSVLGKNVVMAGVFLLLHHAPQHKLSMDRLILLWSGQNNC
jgi:hypothetical protein